MAILIVYAIGFLRYAPTFHDELSLWLHAAQYAPLKPRPHLYLSLALMERHRFSEAQLVLDHTAGILNDASVILQPWDRIEATESLWSNRVLLSRSAGTGVKP